MSSLLRSRPIMLAAACVLLVLIAALGLFASDKPLAATLLVGAAILVMQLAALAFQQLNFTRENARLRRIETQQTALEKLVSRFEWRNGEAARELLAEVRARRHVQSSAGSQAAPNSHERLTSSAGLLRSRTKRGQAATERDLERLLVRLIAQQNDRDR